MCHEKMKKKYSFRLWPILLCLLLIITLLASGCATFERFAGTLSDKKEGDKDLIRIGVLEPLTGDDAEGAKEEILGIELAHELYPEVNGKKVELVYGDHRSELAYVKTAAKELLDQGITAAIGSYGNSYSLAAGAAFQEAEIPIVGATCNNPLVTAGNPFYFRVTIVDSFQGTMAAKYVYENLDEENAIVMKAIGDDYATALSQHFADKMTALTGEKDAVSYTLEYKKGITDFSEQIRLLKAAGNYPVYLPCTAQDAENILKQARKAELENLFIGSERWYGDSFLKGAGAAADGVVLTTFSDAEATLSERTKEFRAAYAKKYGEDEKPSNSVALGFDSYLLILDALTRLQTSGEIARQAEAEGKETVKLETLRDALAATQEYMGATGSLSFGGSGDPIKPVVFMTVENGKFLYKYTASPEWGN